MSAASSLPFEVICDVCNRAVQDWELIHDQLHVETIDLNTDDLPEPFVVCRLCRPKTTVCHGGSA